jgi:hypothetical protein
MVQLQLERERYRDSYRVLQESSIVNEDKHSVRLSERHMIKWAQAVNRDHVKVGYAIYMVPAGRLLSNQDFIHLLTR